MTSTLAPANILGNPDEEDKLFRYWAIRKENDRRTSENVRIEAENVRLAALTPAGTPLPLLPILPSGTAAERKTGAEAFLTFQWSSALGSYYQQAKEDTSRTEARRLDIRNAINTKLDDGKTLDQLLAAINAA